MSFWDDPASYPPAAWPSQPGGTISGTISRMAVRQNRYGNLSLCIELDGDGKERWCPTSLWRVIANARAEPGETITVTRHDDGGTGGVRWTVDKTTPAPAVPPEVAASNGGPSW